LQSYFHRRAAEKSKELLFLFSLSGQKTKKAILSEGHYFSFAVLSTANEKIFYSAPLGSALKFLFIRLPLFIEQMQKFHLHAKIL